MKFDESVDKLKAAQLFELKQLTQAATLAETVKRRDAAQEELTAQERETENFLAKIRNILRAPQ